MLAVIDSSLQELPQKYKETLTLHYLQGMQFKEAAEVLGSTEEAVKKQARRGLKKIRALLE